MACNRTNYKLASFKETTNALCLLLDPCLLFFVDSFFSSWFLIVGDF